MPFQVLRLQLHEKQDVLAQIPEVDHELVIQMRLHRINTLITPIGREAQIRLIKNTITREAASSPTGKIAEIHLLGLDQARSALVNQQQDREQGDKQQKGPEPQETKPFHPPNLQQRAYSPFYN